jgi:N-methylhydantoinase B
VNRYRFLKKSDIAEKFRTSQLVNDIDELKGTPETLQLRQQDFTQNPDDVYAVLWSAAGGFGDPLERDPAKVAADVGNGDVSTETARNVYGVVIGNEKATRDERQRMRLSRVRSFTGRKLAGAIRMLATENLAVRGDRWCCAKCATDLGPASANYKAGCVRSDLAIQASNPIVGDPRRFIDPLPQFRQFCCPGCGALIENEIAIAEDPLLMDVQLHLK